MEDQGEAELGKDEFRMPSGATLYVSTAPWGDIKALHDAVLKELQGRGVAGLDMETMQKLHAVGMSAVAGASKPGDLKLTGLDVVIDKVLGLASSKAVEAAAMKCAERALYRPDGSEASSIKVTPALFDDARCRDLAREDYYAIVARVATVNLRPFIKALSSLYAALAGRSAGIRKSSASSETPSTLRSA